ncbi:HIT domain-containing protein [Caulobacter sp. 17J65-9]|uniref:HIT domain-containing protein n=1 Tax=Caulobacter sp. 17J65-9 TaxID=2709382 RepID=UPI0013CA7D40|nr:HIT domain-containing protein [Caulobacter sp. 17J65-9]NEX92711.1 HIT domain-containing protein [Caulobacter sp. 17J65-9]
MSTPDFSLHPNLEATSDRLADLPLSQARLQLDARFPWIVLIPRRAGAGEIDDLSPEDRARLMEEISLASVAVRAIGEALGRPVEKLNVGALGLVTPQLHVHVLGRRRDDGLWPDPVWGRGAPIAYAHGVLDHAKAAALAALKSCLL